MLSNSVRKSLESSINEACIGGMNVLGFDSTAAPANEIYFNATADQFYY